MSLSEMQACLARLYADDLFRDSCKRDWGLAHRYYVLSDTEKEALSGLDKDRLDAFAVSIRQKRLNKIRSGYGLLYRLPIKRLNDLETRFCQLFLPKPQQSYFDDLISFGQFMEDTLGGYPDRPAFAPDLARYERAFHQARALGQEGSVHITPAQDCPLSHPFVITRSFSYDILTLDRRFASSETALPDCPRTELHLAFPRCAPQSESRVLKLNREAKLLLDSCDGRTPVAEIVDRLAIAESELGAESDVRATLKRLSDEGLVHLEH